MRLYEALFLIESGRAASDWESTEGELMSILERHGGAVRQKAYYEERKLAYPVNRSRRGAYLLVHFDAEPPAIQEIHGDLNLSEAALRTMITVVEKGELPELKAIGNVEPSTPKTREEKEAERAAIEKARSAAAAERAAAEAEKTPVKAVKTPVEAEKTPVEAEKAPVEAEKAPAEAEKVPGEAEKAPAEAEKAPAEAEKAPAEAEEAPAVEEEKKEENQA